MRLWSCGDDFLRPFGFVPPPSCSFASATALASSDGELDSNRNLVRDKVISLPQGKVVVLRSASTPFAFPHFGQMMTAYFMAVARPAFSEGPHLLLEHLEFRLRDG